MQENQRVKRAAIAVVALLLVAGVVGAVVVNRNAQMDMSALNPDAAMADAVQPLMDAAPKEEAVYSEPEGEFVVADDEEAAKDGEEVETVPADDTMKDGDKWEEEVAELEPEDEEGMKDFKAGKDILAAEDSRKRCRCARYRAIYRRRCRRRCFRRRYRVCRWRRYRRCYRRRYRVRVRKSSDDFGFRYKWRTHCRYYRRRVCGWRYRRFCRNFCRRYYAGRRCVRRVCRSASRSA